MKFLLNTRYALRGWLKIPIVLFDLEKNRALRNLTLVEFLALKACDGENELSLNETLQQLLDNGIIAENKKNKNIFVFLIGILA